MTMDGVRVSVPASASGFGPGLGTLGLALAPRLELTVHAVARPGAWVGVSGTDFHEFPFDARNLCVRSLWAVEDALGASRTGLEMSISNRIPTKRGFGSSVASVVAAGAAALTLSGAVDRLDPEGFHQTLFSLSQQMIGRPSACAASVFGSLSLVWRTRPGDVPRSIIGAHPSASRTDRWTALRLEVAQRVHACLLVPDARRHARLSPDGDPEASDGTLRDPVRRDSVITALGRQGLLLQALGQAGSHLDVDDLNAVLFDATLDPVRLPHFAEVMPDCWQLVNHLRSQGFAAVLVGSGPSVLVLHASDERVGAQESWVLRLRALVQSEWLASGRWTLRRTAVDHEGVRVTALG